MNQVIVVPLDGSPAAEAALRHAEGIASATGWTIRPLHVLDELHDYSLLGWPFAAAVDFEQLWQREVAEARAYLDRIARRLDEQGFGKITLLLEGDPARAIIGYAQEHPEVAMIVMTTSGRSGVERYLLGSVAEKILQSTPVPLLLVRASEPALPSGPVRYGTILVPLDGSIPSEEALPLARALAGREEARTVLLQILDEPASPFMVRHGLALEPDQRELLRRTALDYLAQKALLFTAAGLAVETRVEEGQPAAAILANSAAVEADLIVMATAGLSGLSHLWMGSVATRVLRTTTRPVLLVRRESRQPAPL